MIFWVASYPRSGNTYARIVLERSFGIVTLTEDDYFWGDAPTGPVTAWEDRSVAKLGLTRPPVGSVAEFASRAELFALKTHSQSRPTPHPAIYLVRDGRDALVSYAHYVLERIQQLPREQITPELFHTTLRHLLLDPDPVFGSWSDNVTAWMSRPDVAVIPFARLISEPLAAVSYALEQLGLEARPTGGAPPRFDELQSRVPTFFRSGQMGEWRAAFPPDLLPLFMERCGDTIHQLGFQNESRVQASPGADTVAAC